MDDSSQIQMTESIERLMRRDFPSEVGIFSERRMASTQLVYIEEQGIVHAVRVETSYEDCIFDLRSGVHAARDLQSNQRWISLPIREFKRGERRHRDILSQTCKERGVGIILVQSKGRGQSAKAHLLPATGEGDFLEHYPDLASSWAEADANRSPEAAWQVVPLH